MLRRTTNQAMPITHRRMAAYWSLQQKRKSQNLARGRKRATIVEAVVATVMA